MRMTNFLLSIFVCLGILGAYVAGHYMGESEGREASGDALFNLDASRSAEAFALASSVRQALRESRLAQADLLVVRSAALKAPSLVACAAIPDCRASVGRSMPTKAQIDEVLAAERAIKGQ